MIKYFDSNNKKCELILLMIQLGSAYYRASHKFFFTHGDENLDMTKYFDSDLPLDSYNWLNVNATTDYGIYPHPAKKGITIWEEKLEKVLGLAMLLTKLRSIYNKYFNGSQIYKTFNDLINEYLADCKNVKMITLIQLIKKPDLIVYIPIKEICTHLCGEVRYVLARAIAKGGVEEQYAYRYKNGDVIETPENSKGQIYTLKNNTSITYKDDIKRWDNSRNTYFSQKKGGSTIIPIIYK